MANSLQKLTYLEGFLPAEPLADRSSESFRSFSISSRYLRSSSDSAVPGAMVCVKETLFGKKRATMIYFCFNVV